MVKDGLMLAIPMAPSIATELSTASFLVFKKALDCCTCERYSRRVIGLRVAPSTFKVAAVWPYEEANIKQQEAKTRLLKKGLQMKGEVLVSNLNFRVKVKKLLK